MSQSYLTAEAQMASRTSALVAAPPGLAETAEVRVVSLRSRSSSASSGTAGRARVEDEVADVLAESAVAGERPVEEHDLAVGRRMRLFCHTSRWQSVRGRRSISAEQLLPLVVQAHEPLPQRGRRSASRTSGCAHASSSLYERPVHGARAAVGSQEPAAEPVSRGQSRGVPVPARAPCAAPPDPSTVSVAGVPTRRRVRAAARCPLGRLGESEKARGAEPEPLRQPGS